MTLPKYSIRDQLFSHAFSTSNWYKPTYFEWDFQNLSGEFVFFTDNNLSEASDERFSGYKKYAWLVESPVVTPHAYAFAEKNPHLFDKIFTHSEKLLSNSNAYVLPIGGCHLDEDEVGTTTEKTKLISMMYSNKNFSYGQSLRHEIAQRYTNVVDVMGSGVNGQKVKKIESCRDYAFSIVIENCKEGYYFTEKIIDCFLSGVIPIYWGSPRIAEFFNKDGFFTFDTLQEVEEIISNPNMLVDFFNSREKEIVENYQKALEFKIGEDYLYKTYGDIL
jgi:hypothetical protein